jgi:hypothetical protein
VENFLQKAATKAGSHKQGCILKNMGNYVPTAKTSFPQRLIAKETFNAQFLQRKIEKK